MKFKTPLAVYIVWHPDYSEGLEIANFLYSTLCRKVDKPLVRSLGIPVYFRFIREVGKNKPIDINFEESEYTAIVPLISDDFILDAAYKNYIDALAIACNKKKNERRIFPVSLCPNAFNVSTNLHKLNFIRTRPFTEVCAKKAKEDVNRHIKNSLLHELCRLLRNMKRSTEEKKTLEFVSPVKLFISHSKHDDIKNDAVKFRNYINSETQLKTFFDVNDIAYGSDWQEELKQAVKNSALLVFQSDSYSDREWCRIELMEAKKIGCPIVVVNAVENGEQRTFPYIGNSPSIRLKDNYEDIVALILEQVLFNQFTRARLDQITDIYGIKANRLLSTAPELFDLARLKEEIETDEKFMLVVYADPPLGSEEIELLDAVGKEFAFITPISLSSIILKHD